MRFERTIDFLKSMPRHGDPALQSEVDLAIAILTGKRRGVADAYDATMAKLERFRASMMDYDDRLNQWLDESTFPHNRALLKARLSVVHKVLNECDFIEARNRHLNRHHETDGHIHELQKQDEL